MMMRGEEKKIKKELTFVFADKLENRRHQKVDWPRCCKRKARHNEREIERD